ncbi:hypothetical protein BXZ70DRAFT_1080636 [Cristinia sonorae]|uniref:Fungal-type protein kinase domain-containing protein n=1 Tax=Cristinia sonorae TaxID=1940300 RepID=A0A8K0UFR6_9AGAR|nr:hypothetical protein BXZ70DRAFT_1080636 [Cristinia sonorae]
MPFFLPPQQYYKSEIPPGPRAAYCHANHQPEGAAENKGLGSNIDSNCPRPLATPPRAKFFLSIEPQFTPVAQRMGSGHSESGTPKDQAVKEYLLTLLDDKITRNYSVVRFIEAVWGLRREDLKEPGGGYILPVDSLKAYAGGVYDKTMASNIKVEHSAYEPLTEIFLSIIRQVRTIYGNEDPHLRASFVKTVDHFVQGSFTNPKPDFIWSWLPSHKNQSWLLTALCGGLNKTTTRELIFNTIVDINIVTKSRASTKVSGSSLDFRQTAAPSVVSSSTSGRKRKPVADIPSSPTSTPNTAKRSRTQQHTSTRHAIAERLKLRQENALSSQFVLHVAPEVNPPVAPRISSAPLSTGPSFSISTAPPNENIAAHEIQIIKDLDELGSHGIRSYATGFLVVNYNITLWYIDRMGVVETAPFDFAKDPHLLVYFIAAVTRASMTSLGLSSLLEFPHSHARRVLTCDTSAMYKDANMVLNSAVDIKRDLVKNLEFSIDVNTDSERPRHIVPTYGAVGRATVVIPVVASESTAAKIDVNSSERQKLVIKMSWQSRWRDGEDDIIRDIHTALAANKSRKAFLDNIVNLKASMTRTMQEMELPRAKMFTPGKAYERVCRVVVMPEYLPLTAVKTVAEFKKIFAGVLRGHNAVYEESRILHRDVSVNNIMFHYKEINGRVVAVGVLCDWDLAKRLPPPAVKTIGEDLIKALKGTRDLPDANGFDMLKKTQPTVQQPSGVVAAIDPEKEEKASRYRTGTGPFIALDILLYSRAPFHLYRHDLESFFWVLVWFVATPKTIMWRHSGLALQRPEEYRQGKEWTKAIDDNADPEFKVLCRAIDKLRVSLILPLYFKYTTAEETYAAALKKLEEKNNGRDRDGGGNSAIADDLGWGDAETDSQVASEEEVSSKGYAEVEEEMERSIHATVVEREAILTFKTFFQCLR